MERTGISDIRLYVRNEEDLYVPFAPNGEFHDRVKNCLRTKLSGKDFGNSVRMIVASPGPINEDRLIPIMGSVALGRVASTCIIDWPVIKAKRKLIDEISQASTVVFERTENKG